MSAAIESLIDNIRKRNLGGDEQQTVEALLRVLDRRPDLRKQMDARDLSYLKGMARGRYGRHYKSATPSALFNEADHPRGQPENAGEFAKKEGGGSGGKAESGKDAQVDHATDYKQNGTRAKAFKSWFGDWENDPANASKVVNAKGEPQETHGIDGEGSKVMRDGKPVVVYHGTARGGFDSFDMDKVGEGNLYGKGFYFTESEEIANSYQEKDRPYELARSLTPKDMKAIERWLGSKEVHRMFNEDIGMRQSLREVYANWKAGPEAMASFLATDNHDNSYANKLREKLKLERKPTSTPETKAVYLSIKNPVDLDQIHTNPAIAQKVKQTAEKLAPESAEVQALLQGMSDKNPAYWTLTHKSGLPTVLQAAGYDGMTHIGGDRMGGGKHHRVWIAFHPTQIKAVDNEGTFDPKDARMRYARWEESKHPRSEDGKFGKGAGDAKASERTNLASFEARLEGKLSLPNGKDAPSTVPPGTVDSHAESIVQQANAPGGLWSKLKGAGKWLKDKTKQVYDALEGRYGRKAAIAIFAAGHVVGLGTPLAVLPGSTLIGMAPFAAMAEVYLQAKKGIEKLLGRYGAEEAVDIQQLARDMVNELQAAWAEYLKGEQAGKYARDWNHANQQGRNVEWAEIEEAANMLSGSGVYVAWNDIGEWEVIPASVMGVYCRGEARDGGVMLSGQFYPS